MDVSDVIVRLGGTRAVQELTGLTKGRISQWRSENKIPRPWLMFLQNKRPDAFRQKGAKRERRAVA